MPWRLRGLGLPLAHFTTGRAPRRSPVPYVLTVHDLSVLEAPALYPRRERLLAAPWLDGAVPGARAVIAVSQDTARALARRYGERLPATYVVPEAPARAFSAPLPPEEVARVRRAYGLGPRCWLHVGALGPRKNLPRLVAAFAAAREGLAGPPPELLLAGPSGADARSLERVVRAQGLGAAVRMLGWVPEPDLPALYAAAELVAIPSLYEGCGLPALEAMAAGVPVLASEAGGLGEAVGEAALRVDPRDTAALGRGLRLLAESEALRAELAARGRARAARRQPGDMAAETLAVYRRALEPPRQARALGAR